MLRFSKLLSLSKDKTYVNEIYPKPVFTSLVFSKKLKKWSAYIDKYIIFKKRLRNFLKDNYDIIHITDHSNAVYLKDIREYSNSRTLITCHDLIAIRQSKDHFNDSPKISTTGKILQNWIYQSLFFADYYACDSRQTQNDLIHLIPKTKKKSEIINLGTDFIFKRSTKKQLKKSIPFDIFKENFIIHVGNACWYKNRISVFRAFKKAKERFKDLKLVLIGPKPQNSELDDDLCYWFLKNVRDIIVLENISDGELKNLYSYAKVLLFPSVIEGFGWPPLEAAIFGCHVITSKTGAIFDLLGNYAIYIEPNDQKSISKALLNTLSINKRKIPKVDLPTYEMCAKNYCNLYKKIIEKLDL